MNLLNKTKTLIKKYYPGEISFLFILFGMLLSLFLFIQIADAVHDKETLSIDNKILLMFRDLDDIAKPIGHERVQYVVRDITALGSSTLLTIITLIVVIYLGLKREIRSIIYVLSAAIGGGILVQILKVLFARPRPEIVGQLVTEITMSFPSGHSAMSAVVYLSIAVLISRIESSYKTRVFIITTALTISFIVGLSRIYLGVHYPTDVLAGWMIGLFWALLCWFVATIIEKRN
ncbi:MAG: phosphatase PAP2 family protein [Melioribacteraceae bacterium]|nr:phosphatase PAP2 family protein [Melioribacteraceae bacterium]